MVERKQPIQPESQSRRFIEAARQLGADRASEKRFDAALRKVANAPPAPAHKHKPATKKRKGG